jgi:hypothetical protein
MSVVREHLGSRNAGFTCLFRFYRNVPRLLHISLLEIGALFAVVSAARAQFAGLRDSPNLTSGLISGRQRGHIGGGKT